MSAHSLEDCARALVDDALAARRALVDAERELQCLRAQLNDAAARWNECDAERQRLLSAVARMTDQSEQVEALERKMSRLLELADRAAAERDAAREEARQARMAYEHGLRPDPQPTGRRWADPPVRAP